MNPDRGYRKSSLPPHAKRVFEGEIFDIYQWEQELYDGSKAVFEKAVRPDTAAVIPVLPDGSVLLIEDSQPHRDTVLTVPTGKVDAGEQPEQTARRELLEETGYVVDSLELLTERQITGKVDWIIYTFIGRGAKKIREAEPEPGERIVPRIVPPEEFLSLAASEKMLRMDTAELFLEATADPRKMDALRKRLFG